MIAFRHATIKGKLITLTMLSSTVGLVVFFALFGAYDILSFRRDMVRDLAALAQIAGANSSAALEFEDESQAAKTLSALAARPHIVTAALYTKDGKVLAQYHSGNGDSISAPAKPGV